MTFSNRSAASSGEVNERLPVFNLDLSFRLEPETTVTYRRRLVLVAEALKSIADRDARLASWFVLPVQSDGWVHVRAVIRAHQPGEAAELSERWMTSAISAANLAEDPAAARLPDQRADSSLATPFDSIATIASQVSADPVLWHTV